MHPNPGDTSKLIKTRRSLLDPFPNLPIKVKDYLIIKQIGKGGFAKVFLARDKKTQDQYFALKVVKRVACDDSVERKKQLREAQMEIGILRGLRHVFIVNLHQSFDTEDNLYSVFEFVPGGDLFGVVVILI
jgi:serine/threonine protein kinase